jgi:hypothetical protein
MAMLMRFARLSLSLPAILWLLLPPICICHLPERLLGMPYQADPFVPLGSSSGQHAPGCPAAKKHVPHSDAEQISEHFWAGLTVLSVSVPNAQAQPPVATPLGETLSWPPKADLYLVYCCLLN